METPVQLEFHGFEPSAHVREAIEAHIVKFEDRFGRITSCRVVVRQPGAHHRMGEPYAVSIAMAMPGGKTVNVSRKSNDLEPRLADINFAVNEAFRRAARQLREQARKLQGNVKQHAVRQ
jgi:ribosome-associated translation inhibitor RaiA